MSVLLPLPVQEEQFVTYIGCAFALKVWLQQRKKALLVLKARQWALAQDTKCLIFPFCFPLFHFRLFSFSISWSFRCQWMFSSLTGRDPETKGAGIYLVQYRASRCCRLHRKSLPDWLFLSLLLWSLHFQASVIRSGTLHQSASGEPTLWPTNGMRSRPPAKSTRPFRLWPCSSFSRCLLD